MTVPAAAAMSLFFTGVAPVIAMKGITGAAKAPFLRRDSFCLIWRKELAPLCQRLILGLLERPPDARTLQKIRS
jgi:hypothetical protein